MGAGGGGVGEGGGGFLGARPNSPAAAHPLTRVPRCLSVSPAEDQLALLLEGGPAFTLALVNQARG